MLFNQLYQCAWTLIGIEHIEYSVLYRPCCSQLFHQSGASTRIKLEAVLLLEDLGAGKLVIFHGMNASFSRRGDPIACSWVPVLLCYSDLRPEMFAKHSQGLANVTQGEIAISFWQTKILFLANADVFQGWPQLFSSPNVLKVNVSLPEEKPLLRGMVVLILFCVLVYCPFSFQNPE